MILDDEQYRTFVTVGTHEQPFDRLVVAVDELARERLIPVPVFIQSGYCDYKPEYCDWEQFIAAEQMTQLMEDATLVITHGGPSSFMEARAAGKAPVVVPRMAEYAEHINDHQVEFARLVERRLGGLFVVKDISDLLDASIKAINGNCVNSTSNNEKFCDQLRMRIAELVQ